MNDEFKNSLGFPLTYKGIDIYPVKLIDSEEFYDVVKVLLFEKNKIQDVNVIKMSYLKFILILSSEDEQIKSYLKKLFKLTTGYDVDFLQDQKEKIYMNIKDQMLTENDFDKIRKIILRQNLIHLNEKFYDPELEKKLEEAKKFMAKKNGKQADLPQQIIAYHCLTGMKYEDIANLTIYQFNKGLERFNLIKHADVLQAAQYSGFVEFKDNAKIPSWLSYIEDSDPYDDIIISKSEFDKMAIDKGIVSK